MIRRLPPGVIPFVGAIALLYGFIFSWRYFSRINPYDFLMPAAQSAISVPIQLDDVFVRTRSGGRVLWQVHADRVIISPDRRSITAANVGDGLFYREGAPLMHFEAGRIGYNLAPLSNRSNLTIAGGAHVWTERNREQRMPTFGIRTSSVLWNGSTSIAACPEPVRFEVQDLGDGAANGLAVDMYRRRIDFASLAVTTDSSGPSDPAASVPTPQPPESADADSDIVTYAASRGGHWDETNRVLTLQGAVEFQQGKAKVEMDGATYDRKSDTATSSSPVTITDTDTTVTGDRGDIEFAKHLAILSGHIIMKVLPKPEDKVKEPEAKKPTTIFCDQVNYDYKAKLAQTTGQVVIKQPGRTVTADNGDYDVALKIVTLAGNVIGKSVDGKVMKAPNARVSVDPNDEYIDLTGPVTGQVTISSQDNPLPAPSSSKTQPLAPVQSQ